MQNNTWMLLGDAKATSDALKAKVADALHV